MRYGYNGPSSSRNVSTVDLLQQKASNRKDERTKGTLDLATCIYLLLRLVSEDRLERVYRVARLPFYKGGGQRVSKDR
jgi:hypothetical protein